jgi:hypothetical protein
MSKDRKIDDSELTEISGAGNSVEPDNTADNSLKTHIMPGGGGGGGGTGPNEPDPVGGGGGGNQTPSND